MKPISLNIIKKTIKRINQGIKKKDKFVISILLIGLSFSLLVLIKSLQSTSNTKILNYKLESIAHNPILKISDVIVTECTERFKYSNLSVNITFKFNIIIENVGNSISSVVYSFCANSETYKNNLRKSSLNSELNNEALFKKRENEEYYKRINILPDEKKSITFETPIMFVNNDEFTIQLLIYYINELGVLYDTYYKIKYKKEPSKWIIEEDSLGKPINAYIEKPGELLIVKYEVKYKSYKEDEKETILKALNILAEQKAIKLKKIHKGIYE